MAKRPGKAKRLPRELLGDVSWCFSKVRKFRSRKKFVEEMRRYHEGVGAEEPWQPDAVALSVGRVRIRAEFLWLDDNPVVELTADDGRAFTVAELMFKIHNALVPFVGDVDCVFFEGLTLAEDQSKRGPPLYELDPGS
jgi:hypothetical protein